jgi:poly(A) polymerase
MTSEGAKERGSEGNPIFIPVGSPWDEGRWACAALQTAGHEAWMVGGCVRDLLLDRPVHDVDIATSAHPDQVAACFQRSLEVGKAFGVMIALHPSGRQIEIATFRTDGQYIDGRRPSSVEFATAVQDVHRRDFTINALLLDPRTGILADHVGGLSDLQARIIRVIDGPQRLAEDRLRVLRAVRFAAHLDFTIETSTWRALIITTLAGLARERVWQEIDKGLSRAPAAWCRLLRATGLAPQVFGGWSPGSAASDRLERLAVPEPLVALALLLDDVPSAELWPWLTTEPLSRDRLQRLRWLREAADILRAAPTLAIRRRLLRHRDAQMLKFYLNCRQEVPEIDAWFSQEQGIIITPWLRAQDLIALGVSPGPMLGRLMRDLEDAQLDGSLTSREQAQARVRSVLHSLVPNTYLPPAER